MSKHWVKIHISHLLNLKHVRKRQRRAQRKYKVHKRSMLRKAMLAVIFGERSKIIEMIAGNQVASNKSDQDERLNFKPPAHFSIIDNPQETVDSLKMFAAQICSRKASSIFIDMKGMIQYDLGANAILDAIVDELEMQSKLNNHRPRWSGTYPTDIGQRRFVKAMGVIKHLKVKHEYQTREEEQKLALFDKRRRHYNRSLNKKWSREFGQCVKC